MGVYILSEKLAIYQIGEYNHVSWRWGWSVKMLHEPCCKNEDFRLKNYATGMHGVGDMLECEGCRYHSNQHVQDVLFMGIAVCHLLSSTNCGANTTKSETLCHASFSSQNPWTYHCLVHYYWLCRLDKWKGIPSKGQSDILRWDSLSLMAWGIWHVNSWMVRVMS